MTQSWNDTPVFLIGHPRSGTTLLRLALTAHSGICIPPENPFIVSLFPEFGHIKSLTREQLDSLAISFRAKPISSLSQWKVPEGFVQSILDVSEGSSFAELCARIYMAYPRPHGTGTAIWGVKHNSFYRYLDILAWLYPKSQFIHIVRDGRAVLASYKALESSAKENSNFPALPDNHVSAAIKWAEAIRGTEKFLRKLGTDRFLSIKYEDLVTDFRNQIETVCRFMKLPYEAQMEQFYELNRKFDLEPREYDAWKWRTREPVTAERIEVWKQSLAESEIAVIEAVAGKALLSQGYCLENAGATLSTSQKLKCLKETTALRIRASSRHFRFAWKTAFLK